MKIPKIFDKIIWDRACVLYDEFRFLTRNLEENEINGLIKIIEELLNNEK